MITELTPAVLRKEWRYHYGIARRMVGHGERARDFAQEAVIELWRAWERGDASNPGRIVYARRAAKWRMSGLLNGRRRQLGGASPYWERTHNLHAAPLAATVEDRSVSVEDQVLTAIESDEVRHAVSQLPERMRAYIERRFYRQEGYRNPDLERRALAILREKLTT